MRPPFDAPEPDRGGDTRSVLTRGHAALIQGGNPLLWAAVGNGDVIIYDPARGWKWVRENRFLTPEKELRVSDAQYLGDDPPSAEALALATLDDWEAACDKLPVYLEGIPHRQAWVLALAPRNLALGVIQRVCQEGPPSTNWHAARGYTTAKMVSMIWDGTIDFHDAARFLTPGRRRAVERMIASMRSNPKPGQPPQKMAPSAGSQFTGAVGAKPERAPIDPFAGLSKDEIARMSPGDIVMRMRKLQAERGDDEDEIADW